MVNNLLINRFSSDVNCELKQIDEFSRNEQGSGNKVEPGKCG
jgi:hypothetical protein